MQTQIRAFTQSRGLPAQLVDDLEVFIRQLVRSGAVDDARDIVDSLAPDRSSVRLNPAPDASGPRIAGRYEDLGPIGMGGMGEVRRVRDVELNRILAMKTLHHHLLSNSTALVRFLDEAQATAQLQHPNIVPVHDIGTLPDGRVWFTMKEVQGRTLGDAVAEVHAVSSHQWLTGAQGWTLRRLMNVFLSVCRAVAYAHQRGVVHRDLKPTNVMVGKLGETYVLDWGVAKILGRHDAAADEGALDVVETSRGRSHDHRTQAGRVFGTPSYMPPEQARGEVHRIDARSDVYALGAMLYEILSGRAPYVGDSAAGILQQVVHTPPVPLGTQSAVQTLGWGSSFDGPSAEAPTGPPLPEELVEACERAMSREQADRYQSANELVNVVEAWLDGARRREQAVKLTQTALSGVADADALVARATALRAESEALLKDVEPWRPEEDKVPGWVKAKEADDAERAALLKQLEVEQGLHSSLRLAPDLPEAHAALADRYRARHVEAEASRDREATTLAELQLNTHSMALPEDHPTRRAVSAYTKGDGALTLVTDPPGAEVRLYRYVEHHRRLVPVFERSLGTTPLAKAAVPMGTYLCILRHPDRADVRYPIEITRLGHWDGVRPGAHDPHPIWLPPEGHYGPDEVYVPAGRFRSGGDPHAHNRHPARRLWADAFVVQRFPVTNRAYIAFLDDLVAQGRESEALEHVPRERGGKDGELGAMLLSRTTTGGFELQTDADGDTWHLDWPVVHLDWHGARAYLQWFAEKTGRPWRLPGELEREKASRGVDGRWFPWGDAFDPSWGCTRFSHAGRPLPAVVDSYPVDDSPFGVRGVAGNVRDWCAEIYQDLDPAQVINDVVTSPPVLGDVTSRTVRVTRGGAWNFIAVYGRCAFRSASGPQNKMPTLGVRGCFALESTSGSNVST